MTTVVWGSTKKPVTSQRLAAIIERAFPEEGFLYVGYPVLSTPEGTNSIDVLWVSPKHGIVIFHLIEGRDVDGYAEAQDEYANNLETRLRAHKTLMRGRNLLAAPAVITYAPRAINTIPDEEHLLANDDNLLAIIGETGWGNPELYESAQSVIQSISSIRRGRRRRNVTKLDSRGAVLKALEDSIANLDSLQSRAVIETVEGVQRIRGLAGSGKTIILALKAAYLHAQHPDWEIAVTFNTRSLKGQFLRLIENFVVEQTGEPPDWTKVQVLNAWGAPGGAGRAGVYYQFCSVNGAEFLDFQSARTKFRRGEEFSAACQQALAAVKAPKKIFDAILVDEAQDFDASFLTLCFYSLGDPRRLVYAYDELQSLTETSLPPPEELFGRRPDGTPNVVFEQPQPGRPSQDIILEKCYRNSRPVLATAHALGFGVYRNPDPKSGTGLIQMFERAELWEDVGYAVVAGALRDGSHVTLSRTQKSSPKFLESPAEIDNLVEFIVFDSVTDQSVWIANHIEKSLKEDDLSHSDIIVINPDPLTTVKQVGAPRRLLFEKGIQSHVAGVDTSSDVFFKTDEDSIAFTGIFRAKGNEAGLVYVMNAQDCYGAYGNLLRVRNQLFTAITRSKAWVKVLGVGRLMEKLKSEYELVVQNNYTLKFVYPNEETRKNLKVINRDLSLEDQKKIKGATAQIRDLAADLESGRLMLHDLPEAEIRRLQDLLARQLKS